MTCPICKEKTDPNYKPFCSKRCADVDLGKWFSEHYRLETDEVPTESVSPDPEESS